MCFNNIPYLDTHNYIHTCICLLNIWDTYFFNIIYELIKLILDTYKKYMKLIADINRHMKLILHQINRYMKINTKYFYNAYECNFVIFMYLGV